MRSRLLLLFALLFGISTIAACTVRRGSSRGGGDDDDDDDDSAVSDDDDAANDDDAGDDDDMANDDDDTGGPAELFVGAVAGSMEVVGVGLYTCSGAVEMDVSGGTATGSASCDFTEPTSLPCNWTFSEVPLNGTGDVLIDCMDSSSVLTLSDNNGDMIEGSGDWTDNTNLFLYIEFTAFSGQ